MSPEAQEPEPSKLGTIVGLIMSSRASLDAAMRMLVELTVKQEASPEPTEEGVCSHPADQRSLVTTMGDGPPMEFCKVCGERLR